MNIMWETFQEKLLKGLLDGDDDSCLILARLVLSQGASPTEFFTNCVTPVMVEVGNLFETLEIFLPEMVIAAEIVKTINDQVLQPAILEDQAGEMIQSQGKVALATVQGDMHDIGKNMVALMLRVNGFDVVDLGINVAPAEIVERSKQEQVDIIGMSSLLTTCLPYMKDTVDYLNAKGLRNEFAVIIGGAAPNDEFARAIGVDGQGHSAVEAVRMCKEIMHAKAEIETDPK